MKLLISVSAVGTAIAKGSRVAVKQGQDYWIGTVVRRGAEDVSVNYDEGMKGKTSLRSLTHLLDNTKLIKKPLTKEQVAVLKEKRVAADQKAKSAAIKAAPAKRAVTVKATVSSKKAVTVKAPTAKAAPAAKKAVTVKAAPAKAVEAENHSVKEWLGKITPEKMKAEVTKLEAQLKRLNAQGMNAARRAGDAGPMDIMWERIQPLETKLKVYQATLANPGKPLPKDVQASFDAMMNVQKRNAAYKESAKQNFQSYPDMVGMSVEFPSKRGLINAVVTKQVLGRFGGAPKYKAQVPGSSTIWTIGHSDRLKFSKPKDFDKVKDDIKKSIDSAKEKKASIQPGQAVSWNSTRLGRVVEGVVVSVGRTKVKIQEKGTTSIWTVPLGLIL